MSVPRICIVCTCTYALNFLEMSLNGCAGRSMVTEEGASGDAPGRNAGAFVQALLDLRDTYNRFLHESFTGDQQFKNAIASVSVKEHLHGLHTLLLIRA